MCESAVEEADAVVSAALGSAQERAESHLLAAGGLGARRRQRWCRKPSRSWGKLDADGRANARLLAQQITGAD
jgi:hypothetical protein